MIMNKYVTIDGREIGPDRPCYVMLEAGVNFDDMRQARELIDAAAGIGADCIKFQTFHAGTTVVRNAHLQDGRGVINQYDELKESEDRQTREFQQGLFSYARTKNITAFSTPSHRRDVDMLEGAASPPAYKIGSDDLTNIPLLKYVARLKKPMIISTGVSYMTEIDQALRVICGEGNDDIILLHCVSQYPAQPKDINLLMMSSLEKAFGRPVGLSDHTMTTSIPIAAAAMGACVIEKHFTLKRDHPGPDNFFSMMPEEMEMIIKGIREVEAARGCGYKTVVDAEKEMRAVFRKSIHAVRLIRKGEILSDDNVDILRPADGLEPALLPYIMGKPVHKDIAEGEAITWECLLNGK